MIRVLLVEESPTLAAALSIAFAGAGFTVEQHEDAQGALASLQTAPFDLVVLDLELPGLSGFELCRAIKENPSTREVRVMLLTRDANPGDVLSGLEAGADGFITRDRSPEEILGRAERTLASRDAATPATFQGRTFPLNVGVPELRNVLVSALEDGVELNRRLAQSEAALRLVTRDLQKTNEVLAAANTMKDKFLGIAAHDLRSPLAVILGFTSLMADGTLGAINDEQVDALQRITRSVDALLSLLTDLLHLSALRDGKVTFHPIAIDLESTLRDALESAEPSANEKQIAITSAIDGPLRRIEADPDRMLELISHLLSNAVKFTPRGGQVTLGARGREDGVEIWVRDSGPGILEAERHLLFQPLSKLSARPTGSEPSAGLGLAIAKEIVDWHGGVIAAESEAGAGSTFRVDLPRRLPRRDG
jgi:signal transduction histidine kinase